jgi:hypothetical protein
MADLESLSIRDQRQPGWFFVDNEIVDVFGERLGAYGIAVYCVLSRYAKNGSQQVNLSARDIGKALSISQDRVRKSLTDLVEVELIHLLIPEHPAPGLISTITLLNVKVNRTPHVQFSHPTERHTFSSGHQLNATHSHNKEEKTKTKTETLFPPNPLSGVFSSRDRRKFFSELNRIYNASQGSDVDEQEAIAKACVITGTPLAIGKQWVAQSYGEDIPA